jgi:cytochrome b involved in lipid metabolism
VNVAISFGEGPVPSAAPSDPAPPAPAPAAAPKKMGEYSAAEVAKHNTDKDCWVIVNGQVLDVTSFLNDHPGGKKVIMIYAGRDATEEFNMMHKPDVIEKYAPEVVIGTLKK